MSWPGNTVVMESQVLLALRIPYMLRRVLPALFVLLLPLQAHAWWNSDFTTRKKISFNTSAQGVETTTDQSFVPVLVRLHTGNFGFADAKPDGADLRFVANDDKTALKYHLESFDGINELATVWVQVPKLAAHQTADYIWVYYGSDKASAGDDVKGTFDPGYAAVLHLTDTPAKDATLNAVPVSGDAKPAKEGLIALSPDPAYASPTPALLAQQPQFQAELAAALTFIKPSFNEDMRGGHTNM